MIKRILLTCLIFLAVSLLCSESKLNEVLREKAYQNIKNLSEEKIDELNDLLHNYQDILMYFLIAAEEPYKLQISDTTVIEDHYLHVRENHWHLTQKYNMEFFLSYIAKITVTDERITPYRNVFEEYGISDISKGYSDLYEQVRYLNLWCRKYMTFRPTSGRDLSPIDILKKSHIGRCEEMQIFFISAARTLGIPARPAYTPLWAHTDNNHAWVEVFVNDEWKYLGAVEPDYYLNKAWFTGNINKAVLIMAKSFFPDPSENLLFQSEHTSFINSTMHYRTGEKPNTRSLSFDFFYEDGTPADSTEILFKVFNWGMLRPILRLNSNDLNSVNIDIGVGSFAVVAHRDSLVAFEYIPYDYSNSSHQLILGGEIPESYFQFEYPENTQMEDKNIPDYWGIKNQETVDYYNNLIEAYQSLKIDFIEADSLTNVVWGKFRNNKTVFKDFLLQKRPSDEFIRFLNLIDEKFLWQAKLSQLNNVYSLYEDLQENGISYSDDLITVILQPGVYFEELSSIRLSEEFLQWRGLEINDIVTGINNFLLKKYEINDEFSIGGLLPVDEILKQKYITETQFKILFCYVLRHNFIPSFFSRTPETVLINKKDTWSSYNFIEKKFNDFSKDSDVIFQKIEINFIDEYNHPVKVDDSKFTLSYFQNGMFYPYQTEHIWDNFKLVYHLPENIYFLHIGYRPSGTSTEYYLIKIDNTEDIIKPKTIKLHNYKTQWELVTDEFDDFKEIAKKHLINKDESRFFIFGEYSREVIQRMINRLGLDNVNSTWIGSQSNPDSPDFYVVDKSYHSLLSENQIYNDLIITLYFNYEKQEWFFYSGVWEIYPD